MIDETKLKNVIDSSPKILHFPAIDEKLRMALLETELFSCTQTEIVQDDGTNVLSASPVNLNNWDTVTVVRADRLNKEVAEKKTYPQEVKFQVEEADTNGTYAIDGTFQPWQITPGGDGRNLWFRVPFQSGSFCYNGNTFDLGRTSLVISVSLAYFPRPAKQAEDGSYRLSVNTSSDAGNGTCVAILRTDSNGDMPTLTEAVFSSVMRLWLNSEETLSKFQPLFATVVVDNGSSKDFAWLKPTYMSYAYRDSPNIEEALFGVLCMTNNRDGSEGIRQLPLVSMDADEDLIFLVSREIFVRYQYIASLPEAIPGTMKDNYVLGGDFVSVEAKNIKLKDVTYGAVDYHPVLKSFHVYFDESRVRTVLQVDINISPGVDVHSYVETEHVFALSYNVEGEPIMIFKNIGEPIVRNEIETAAWVIVVETLVDLIITIASAAIVETMKTVTQKIILAIVASAVAAIISTVIHEIIGTIVADGTLEKLPSVTPMLQAGVSPVKWPFADSALFQVERIHYNGAFIFQGKVERK